MLDDWYVSDEDEDRALLKKLEERGISFEEYEEEQRMEDLEYDLCNYKQQALIELRKAEEAIKKAYDAVGKYACAINEDETFDLIDPDFLADLTLRTENLGTYSQWITEEKEEMNECRKLCETIPEVKPITTEVYRINKAAWGIKEEAA